MEDINKKLSRSNNMMFLGIAILVVVTGVILYLVIFPPQKNKEVISVALFAPMTGGAAATGAEVERGMLFAEGILEKNPLFTKDFEVTVFDTESDPEKSRIVFEQAMQKKDYDVAVSVLSSVSTALAPLAEKYETPLFALVATAPAVTKESSWVYRYWPTAKQYIDPLLSFLDEEGVTDLYVLYFDDEFGRAFKSYFESQSAQSNLTVTTQSFSGSAEEFLEYREEALSHQAFLPVAFESTARTILSDMFDEGYAGTLISLAGVVDVNNLEIFEGKEFFAVAPIIYNESYIPARAVEQNYRAEFGLSLDADAAGAYDLLRMIGNISDREEEIDSFYIKNILDNGFLYPGIFGSVTVTPGIKDITYDMYVIRIKDGEIFYIF
jgi:ABC-type branched-subunit amino acid transport system substrate-binding protein